MHMEKIRIFDVKHYAVHDGPGIRTTFFTMGCPLRCLWCQNPESQKDETVITFTALRCIGCGNCARVCGKLKNLQIRREDCLLCGKCADVCHADAKKYGSKLYSPEDILKKVLPEKLFFADDGGVTFSGGECMLHADFIAGTCRLLKENGIHSCIDTCGYVPQTSFEKVLPYADLFLYDLKKMDPEKHKEYTGVDNHLILDNLKYLCEKGARVIVRIPLIPGYTDSEEDMRQTAAFIRDALAGKIQRVELLPYNKLAASKYDSKTIWSDYSLGTYPLPEMEAQSAEYIQSLADIFTAAGICVFSESL